MTTTSWSVPVLFATGVVVSDKGVVVVVVGSLYSSMASSGLIYLSVGFNVAEMHTQNEPKTE